MLNATDLAKQLLAEAENGTGEVAGRKVAVWVSKAVEDDLENIPMVVSKAGKKGQRMVRATLPAKLARALEVGVALLKEQQAAALSGGKSSGQPSRTRPASSSAK